MAPIGKITHLVVHYSATAPGDDVDVAIIRKWHLARGFNDIGYHFVIYRDGTIHKGRDETVQGAHVKNQNHGKIGICWLGGVEASNRNKGVDNRTPEQTEALIGLLHDLLKKYPGAEVLGHRDLAATQCPGFDVRTWWAGVQHKKRPRPTPVAPGAPVRMNDRGEDDPRGWVALLPAGAAAVIGFLAFTKKLPLWGWFLAAGLIVMAVVLFGTTSSPG